MADQAALRDFQSEAPPLTRPRRVAWGGQQLGSEAVFGAASGVYTDRSGVVGSPGSLTIYGASGYRTFYTPDLVVQALVSGSGGFDIQCATILDTAFVSGTAFGLTFGATSGTTTTVGMGTQQAAYAAQGTGTQVPLKGRLTGPVQALEKIATDWQLTTDELATLLAYGNASAAENLLNGRVTLTGEDRADRVRQMFAIHRTLSRLFADASVERRWLRTNNPMLSNLSPLEMMMRNRIPGMLTVRNVVERLAGRR